MFSHTSLQKIWEEESRITIAQDELTFCGLYLRSKTLLNYASDNGIILHQKDSFPLQVLPPERYSYIIYVLYPKNVTPSLYYVGSHRLVTDSKKEGGSSNVNFTSSIPRSKYRMPIINFGEKSARSRYLPSEHISS